MGRAQPGAKSHEANMALIAGYPEKVKDGLLRKWNGLINGTVSAVSAPGKAANGFYDLLVDPNTGENYYGGMAEDASNLAGMMTLGAGAIPRPAGTLDMGFKAYHGSPHDFDKFDMSKIGTGVGAPDAYSRGLYFSGAEKNAEHFKKLGASPMIGGKKGMSGLSSDAYELVWRFTHDDGKRGTLADVASRAEADLIARQKELPFSARRDYQEIIDELKARGSEDVRLGANMYEVNIDANPESFADWDLPVSQQSDTVKNALSKYPQDKTWRDIYEGGTVRSQDMLKKGISGTKYKANDGSSNYVVFDDKLIDIIKKYGLAPGAVGAGALAASAASSPSQNQGVKLGA